MDEPKNMTEEMLKKYLKKLLELESEKYRLERNKEKLNSFNLSKLQPAYDKNYKIYDDDSKNINREKEYELEKVKKEIEKNIDSELEKIIVPKEPELKWPEDSPGCLMIIMGIVVMFMLFSSSVKDDVVPIILVGIAFIIIGKIILKKNENKRQINKKIKEDYQKVFTRYKEDISIYKNKLTEDYNKLTKDKIKNIEDKYEIENEEKRIILRKKDDIITNLLNKNEDLINQIQENLELVNEKLEELYSANIIFEKYRNLTAISMFYEFFVSSRVSKLEGRDGAYNLFESEIRQNIIIVKLNDICEHLEDIKQNQYCMYKELVNINMSLAVSNIYTSLIEKHINNIDNNVSDLKEIEQYILVYSNEINKNIKKIKNISIADFLLK